MENRILTANERRLHLHHAVTRPTIETEGAVGSVETPRWVSVSKRGREIEKCNCSVGSFFLVRGREGGWGRQREEKERERDR